MAKETIHESVLSEGSLKVEREAGIIRGVKLLGRVSKNGRTYSQKALEQAAALYVDCDVCIDHPRDPDAPRGMAESFGVLRDVSVRPEGVYGDLHYIKSHALAETIAERAERFPKSFGMSQNALGSLAEGHDGNPVVEEIHHVESVDVVRRPATTAGLFESVDHPSQNRTMKKSLRKLFTESKHKEAPRLAKLLEMDEFGGMADASVEAPAGEEDAVKAGIRTMVNAVLDGDGDPAEKLAKIRQILNAEEKINNGGKGGESKPEGGGDKKPDDATEQLNQRLARFERREEIRDLLEEDGRSLASLTADQRKLLEQAADADAMRALLKTWPVETTGRRDKPPIGRAHSTTRVQESYDDVRSQTRWGRKQASA